MVNLKLLSRKFLFHLKLMESIHAKYVESDLIKGHYNSDYVPIELMLFFLDKIHNLVICIDILRYSSCAIGGHI